MKVTFADIMIVIAGISEIQSFLRIIPFLSSLITYVTIFIEITGSV